MKFKFIESSEQICKQSWLSLNQQQSPFMDQNFFNILEQNDCASAQQGWQPQHLTISEDDRLTGILPAYIKQHSWGEYVFDWAWQSAYERYGFEYLPKLVSTIPFTPVESEKLLTNNVKTEQVFSALTEHCINKNLSSWHLLFCPKVEVNSDHIYQRNTVQFHWFNKDYAHFDDYLATFTARKRKNTRKERLSIQQQDIEAKVFTGNAITEKEIDFFYLCYQLTYFKNGHNPHLSKAFFTSLVAQFKHKMVIIIAQKAGQYIAASLFMFDQTTLYGRYWGATEFCTNLHFELCYYQGIEFCIKHGLKRFNPGTQGEHKIQRGFEPVLTYSYHWIQQAEFKQAIKGFCQQESTEMQQYLLHCRDALPFRK